MESRMQMVLFQNKFTTTKYKIYLKGYNFDSVLTIQPQSFPEAPWHQTSGRG